MTDIFLSYSRDDLNTARRFAEAFEREGFSVWWDQTLNPGEAFDEVTEKALNEARAVVVLWSKKSVASRWVRAEATQANESKTLVPVMIEPCKRPIMFELTHTVDLSNWKGNPDDPAWQSYLAGVKRVVGKDAVGSPSFAATSQTSTRPRQFGVRTLIGVVALLVVVAGVLWFASRPPKIGIGEASVAVLPFDDMSPNKDQGYLADGVAEEILNTLIPIADLRVTARNSSFAFKGKASDHKSIGKTLGVAYLLEGSLRKSGDQLRVAAQLIRADSGVPLWTKTYNRSRNDVFAVEEDIARSVAEKLQVSLGVGLGRRPGMTRNVDAYEAYLAAQAVPALFTHETTQRVIELLSQAVHLDPSFALAWVYLAAVYENTPDILEEDAQGWQQKADAAYKEVERLLPDSPFMQIRLANNSIRQGHLKEAAEHFNSAEKASAKFFGEGDFFPPGVDTWFLASVGRLSAARAKTEQQKARDPLNQYNAWFLAWIYGALSDFPAAFAEFDRGDGLEGTERFRTRTLAIQVAMGARDRAQILRWLDATIAFVGSSPDARVFPQLKPLLDHPKEALALIDSEMRRPSTSRDTLAGYANMIAYFGDNDASLAALHAALERRAGTAGLLMWGPALSDVRRMPGFKQLMRDYGFVEYWQAYGWADLCKPVGKDDFECH